jgi:hypothetical protein
MSQVLQTCESCGKVETPLVEGRCPNCIREGRRAQPARLVGSPSLEREVDRYLQKVEAVPDRVLPSTFIWVGLMLQGLGAAGVVFGQLGLTTGLAPIAAVVAFASLIPAVFGGILVLVGIVRWAIWPLIEMAEKRDSRG